MRHTSQSARAAMESERGEPWFLAGWKDVLMMHFAVRPEILQPFVPFEVDTWEGKAFVSLLGFKLDRLRPRKAPAWLLAPIATHEFLNVRIYVKHGDEKGIYFLAEWLPNWLSVAMGRPLFGLPYRLGVLEYDHANPSALKGRVTSKNLISWTAKGEGELQAAEKGTLTEWLMERYTAFTYWLGIKRRFRVWHPPWPQIPVQAEVINEDLLDETGRWFEHARFVGANWSPGFDDVWMGAPRFL